jgi:hypothetical protein
MSSVLSELLPSSMLIGSIALLAESGGDKFGVDALSSFYGFVNSFMLPIKVFPTFDSIALLAILGVEKFGVDELSSFFSGLFTVSVLQKKAFIPIPLTA